MKQGNNDGKARAKTGNGVVGGGGKLIGSLGEREREEGKNVETEIAKAVTFSNEAH
jgi:hypothetical protein